MHWATEYIGLPWSPHGEGPDSFHCWAFFCRVQRDHFDREMPQVPNPEDLLAMARRFRDHPERRRWMPVDRPAEGDGVLMGQARYPVHVGVWLDVDGGGVLHCFEGCGVVFQRVAALALNGWKVEGYYRFVGECA